MQLPHISQLYVNELLNMRCMKDLANPCKQQNIIVMNNWDFRDMTSYFLFHVSYEHLEMRFRHAFEFGHINNAS